MNKRIVLLGREENEYSRKVEKLVKRLAKGKEMIEALYGIRRSSNVRYG